MKIHGLLRLAMPMFSNDGAALPSENPWSIATVAVICSFCRLQQGAINFEVADFAVFCKLP